VPTSAKINPELRALLSQLRADAAKAGGRNAQLAESLEALRLTVSDLRDELIRGRHATETMIELMRMTIVPRIAKES
jgi:hypothetical protein